MLKRNLSKSKIRRLFWDIEVSPNIVLAWRSGYDQNIPPENIIQERKVICIGYKWENEPVKVLRWDKDQDDKAMLAEFVDVANEADELVAHHGDRFDEPWLRTRCLILGLPPIPIYKTIDTKAWASKRFYFNSNKLDYVSDVLGCGRKLRTNFDLWKKVLLDNDRKALNYMCRYCGVDVEKVEKVYHKMAPYMKPKSHAGVLAGSEKWTCPWTGSPEVVKNKTRVTAAGTKQHQMQSLATGGYYTISDSVYSTYQEFKNSQKSKR